MKSVKKAIMSILLLTLASAWVLGVVKAYTTVAVTRVFVHPDKMKVKIGQVFEVYVNVSDVLGLQGFDFMLTYNTSILDCIALEEGTFLSGFGDTFIAKQEINDKFCSDLGRVWLAIAILGQGYANGSGTVAVVRFNATAVGGSALDLYSDYPHRPNEVKLATCGLVAIPNSAIDGYVVVDCCSDGLDPPVSSPDPVDPPKPDVNNDGFVDIKDLMLIAKAFGASAGVGHYDARADLDKNGLVDIGDVQICARMFGRSVL